MFSRTPKKEVVRRGVVDNSFITSSVKKATKKRNHTIDEGDEGSQAKRGKTTTLNPTKNLGSQFDQEANSSCSEQSDVEISAEDTTPMKQRNSMSMFSSVSPAIISKGLTDFFSPLYKIFSRSSSGDPSDHTNNNNDVVQLYSNISDKENSDVQMSTDSDDTTSEQEEISDGYVYVEDEDFEEGDFDPFFFIATLPPLIDCVHPNRQMILPPKQTRSSQKKTLVLDLDETLVHSRLDDECSSDFQFDLVFNNQKYIVSVLQRPYLKEFMLRVTELFEVVIFTASQQVYAEKLLDIIDPENKLIKHRIYRDSCVVVEGNYLKDLSVLGRDLSQTVIVDNSPQAFAFQIENGIPIQSWYDCPEDDNLMRLIPFLEKLAAAEYVRPIVNQKFMLQDRVNSHRDTIAVNRSINAE